MVRSRTVAVYSGEALGRYGFDDHPFGEDSYVDEVGNYRSFTNPGRMA